MSEQMKVISAAKSHGGVQGVYSHASEACACDMNFAVFCRRRPVKCLARLCGTSPASLAPMRM